MIGKLTGVPIAEYHAADCVSHSKLEDFRKREILFYKRHVAKTLVREQSPAFAVGSALHCMSLEPEHYAERYCTRPEGIDRRTKDGKAQWERFCAENASKEVLDGEDSAIVREMAASIDAHPTASMLLTGGEAEVTWRAKSASLPWSLQCRTDYYNANGCELSEGRPYVADVKTVESLDAEEFRNFERAFYSYGYHRQAGFYLPLLAECGVRCWDFFFIAVEKREPFGCVVYKPTEDAISAGIDETVGDLHRLARCFASNTWANMPNEVQSVGLPSWYKQKNAA